MQCSAVWLGISHTSNHLFSGNSGAFLPATISTTLFCVADNRNAISRQNLIRQKRGPSRQRCWQEHNGRTEGGGGRGEGGARVLCQIFGTAKKQVKERLGRNEGSKCVMTRATSKKNRRSLGR